jgi:hypothetical protein
MPTIHGGSFSKVSLRASRLILLRKAIFPSIPKPDEVKHVLTDVDADDQR